MEATEIAWLAGFLEGEGSFSFYTPKNRPRARTLRIQLNSTDLDVIERAAHLMEDSAVYEGKAKRGRKPFWIVCVASYKAERIMRVILPCMGHRRRDQIFECLAEWTKRPVMLRERGRRAECHPDRPHKGNGLCDECHRRMRYERQDIPRRNAARAAVKRDILWVASPNLYI